MFKLLKFCIGISEYKRCNCWKFVIEVLKIDVGILEIHFWNYFPPKSLYYGSLLVQKIKSTHKCEYVESLHWICFNIFSLLGVKFTLHKKHVFRKLDFNIKNLKVFGSRLYPLLYFLQTYYVIYNLVHFVTIISPYSL